MGKTGTTHVFSDNRSETGNPHQSVSAHGIREQTLAGEKGLAESLALVVLDDPLGTCQKRILAYSPYFVPVVLVHAQDGNVSQSMWCEQCLSRSGDGGLAHLSTGDKFLHAELDASLQSDGRRHADHGAGLDVQWAADGKLDGQNRVAVAVRDAERAAVEGADIVHVGSCRGEMSGGRSTRSQSIRRGQVYIFGLCIGFRGERWCVLMVSAGLRGARVDGEGLGRWCWARIVLLRIVVVGLLLVFSVRGWRRRVVLLLRMRRLIVVMSFI